MDELTNCSICEGELLPLGALGNIEYFRCRNCGAQFMFEKEKQDEQRNT